MTSRTEWAPRPSEPSQRWVIAKWLVLAGYLGLVAALFVEPDRSTMIFWNGLVPLLPAMFLVNVELWRNVCPLATLNAIRRDTNESLPMSKKAVRVTAAAGIAAFLTCLPVRQVILNVDGAAIAWFLAAVGILALLSGLRYQRKAGFCNSVCPILPIERLYGTRPMVAVENARCTPCRACTRSGCIDLGTERSVLQILGDAAQTRAWVTKPFGAFPLAFPGIIAAFYLMPAESGGDVLRASLAVGLGASASWMLLGVSVAMQPIPPANSLVGVSALAAGLYYWFTAPISVDALGLPDASTAVIRVASLTLIAVWLALAIRRQEEFASVGTPWV